MLGSGDNVIPVDRLWEPCRILPKRQPCNRRRVNCKGDAEDRAEEAARLIQLAVAATVAEVSLQIGCPFHVSVGRAQETTLQLL
jgi:hypothetical protein